MDYLEVIDKVKNYVPSSPYIVMPQWWVEKEVAAHPEYFRFYDDGTITWCGYAVYSYGDIYDNKE